MAPEQRGRPALAPGERVLARLKPTGPGRYEGRTVRRLAETPGRVLGVYRHGRIVPTDRRAKAEWVVPPGEDGGAEPGEIVLAEPLPHHRLGLKPARIIERLGAMGDARSVSLIAIHTHDIPQEFPAAALDEAERADATPLGRRTDLRDIAAGHHRRRGRARLRRCGVRRTGRRGLPPDRRDRRRRALRPPGFGAGPRGAHARQQCLLPRPRRADAARGAVQRLVQPAAERGPRLPVRRTPHRRARPQDRPPLRPRPDAQRRPAHLRGGAAGARCRR